MAKSQETTQAQTSTPAPVLNKDGLKVVVLKAFHAKALGLQSKIGGGVNDRNEGVLKGVVQRVKMHNGKWGQEKILEGAFKFYKASEPDTEYRSTAMMFPEHVTEGLENGVKFEVSLMTTRSEKSPTGQTILAVSNVTSDLWDSI